MTLYLRPLLILLFVYGMLPLVCNDLPLLIVHNHQWFCPLMTQYLETDFGGDVPLKMDYQSPEGNILLKEAWVLNAPYPYGLSPDYKTPHHLESPSKSHWLGTNDIGQDILVYALHAAVLSSLTSLILTYLCLWSGSLLGVVAGLYGGSVDITIMWLKELCRSVPFAFLVILIPKHSFGLFMVLFTCTQWTKYAQLCRNKTYELCHQPFMLDASHNKMPLWQRYCQHILPHLSPLCRSQISYTWMNYLAMIESLAYFDIRMYPDLPSLGFLIQQSKMHPQAIWMMTACAIGFGMVGCFALYFSRQKEKDIPVP